jgi:hypothetical protein
MVNRLWHYHFGTGIVANPSDFGVMGFGPSNPKLLDWLASEFVSNGWSLKAMHRLMVTSSTYRQSSAYRADVAKLDSGNRLLWRFPRQRLEGEAIRDSALFVSGLLKQEVGGPSVFPPLPPDINKSKTWVWETSPTADQNRRSVYIFVRRNLRYPMLEVMDMPDTQTSCARRQNTLTAPQALTMLNSDIASGWGVAFGARVIREVGADLQAQIKRAYHLAYLRPPTATEMDLALTFFNRHQKILTKRAAASEKLALPAELPAGVNTVQAAALVDFCLMLLNSNEFVYRN